MKKFPAGGWFSVARAKITSAVRKDLETSSVQMATDALSAGDLLHRDDSQAQEVRAEQQATSAVMEQQRKVNLQRSQERSDQRKDSKTRGLLYLPRRKSSRRKWLMRVKR